MFFPFDDNSYIAVIGDIKRSKALADRNAVQIELQHTLDEINTLYKEMIVSKLIITLGDEFQGLLKTGASFMEIMDRIERDMHPVKLRFGVGVGEITTDIQAATLGTDGPAYYLARDMISLIKKSEKKKIEPTRNIGIKIQGAKQLSALLNATFSLMTTVKETWTARQMEIISLYLQNDSNQTNTAAVMKINQSSVHRALDAANFYTYCAALKTVDELFAEDQEDVDV